MAANIPEAIRLENINYSADGLHILKNITGSFPSGKITALVGPSGAGKSSLFRLCNGLKSPDNGEIFVMNKRVNDYEPTHLRRIVGLALQSAPMIRGTVFDNLNLPLQLQGKQIKQSDAVELLKIVGLEEAFINHKVQDLSGGQRQKVSIARTFVNRPQILLLDEITSSLDRVSTLEIEDLIQQINKKFGTTIIWITHHLEQAMKVGDYTWVMMGGELVESGDISLLKNPKTPKVQQFVKGDIH